MKFYLVWDKEHQQYMGQGGNRGKQPRVYTAHRHAASASMGWIRQPINYLSNEELNRKRRERFEIHEYETDEYTVVG